MYTYFIITPGYAVNSYVRYPDAAEGNYVKFGEATQAHGGAGILSPSDVVLLCR